MVPAHTAAPVLTRLGILERRPGLGLSRVPSRAPSCQ